MFRFAISPALMTGWKQALQQCCDVTQAHGQLYTFSYTRQWRLSEVTTSSQYSRDILVILDYATERFTYPRLVVEQTPFQDQTLSYCPIWLPSGELFAALVLILSLIHI